MTCNLHPMSNVSIAHSVEHAAAKPRVSICMFSYNHARFIREALDGIANQTYRQFKVVACDDGSEDGTYEVLKEYEAGKLAGVLTVLTHPGHVNRGIYHTYNACLEHVDTEFFVGHGSDDFWDPEALGFWVGLMDAHPDIEMLYGPLRCVDAGGQDLYRYTGTRDIGTGRSALESILEENTLDEPSMFYRTASCKGFIRESPSLMAADYLHNILLVQNVCFMRYTRPVVNYRCHGGNISLGVEHEIYHRRQLECYEMLHKTNCLQSSPEIMLRLLVILIAHSYYLGCWQDLGPRIKELRNLLSDGVSARKGAYIVASCLETFVNRFRKMPVAYRRSAEVDAYLVSSLPCGWGRAVIRHLKIFNLVPGTHALAADGEYGRAVKLAGGLLTAAWSSYVLRNLAGAIFQTARRKAIPETERS